ncbi:MAG: hypothetical protein U5J95_12845 [Balneolaceae bacterium]|nr:hypothetical protein [Balneolaceae bacterium]
MGYSRQFTIGYRGEVIGLFKEEGGSTSAAPNGGSRSGTYRFPKNRWKRLKNLRERLRVSVDQETGVLTLSGEFPDPQAAAEISKIGIGLLKKQVKEYRTEKRGGI